MHTLRTVRGLSSKVNATTAILSSSSSSSSSSIRGIKNINIGIGVNHITTNGCKVKEEKCNIINSNNGVTMDKSLLFGGKQYYSTSSCDKDNVDFQNTIEIKGLNALTNKNDVQELFSGLSIAPNGIKMIFDDEENIGFAYVTFDTQSDRLKALQLAKPEINGSKVDIVPLSINKTDWKSISSSSYLNRTAVTNHLWRSRTPIFEIKGKQSPNPAKPIIDRNPLDSYTEIFLHFSSDLNLREMYLSPYGNLRIGRFLEDLDALAGTVSYKHAEGTNEEKTFTIVTASVDRIHLLRPLMPDRDFKMEGIVSWVGKSSMEIMIKVRAMDPTTKQWDPVLVAYFTMVARDPVTKKAAQVNRLVPTTPKEKQLFVEAEDRKTSRLTFAKESLQNVPPTSAELQAIHSLFMISSGADEVREAKHHWIPMEETTCTSVILCQPQERNMHGNIFGGYLMRKGFELAFTTCFMQFSKSIPQFFAMDDITFLLPVDIGNILTLESTIVYCQSIPELVESYYVQVEVIAYVTNPIKYGPEKRKSNTFNFTFLCSPPKDENGNVISVMDKPKKILPKTYLEAMRYIAGKRIVDRQSVYSNKDLDIWIE